MVEADLEAQWDLFLEVEGAEIEKEIYTELQETAHLLDIHDGIHAKWSPDGMLGMLLVFHEDEADTLLAAFHAAIEGVDDAAEAFALWSASLMGLIRQSLRYRAGYE